MRFVKSVLQLLLCRAIKIAKEIEISIWKALNIALHVPSRLACERRRISPVTAEDGNLLKRVTGARQKFKICTAVIQLQSYPPAGIWSSAYS